MKAKPLYVFFHDFESRYGELAQIAKLEKRMRDLYPDDPTLSLFSRRFVDGGFDPTVIRPIVSPGTQTRPKIVSSIEGHAPLTNSPLARLNPIVASPKRPLPLEESDNEGSRPQKLARTTREASPLKGAAGRRLDQQKRNRQPQEIPQFTSHPVPLPPPPPPLPKEVTILLGMIPRAETYHATKFSAQGLVRLLRETYIPTHESQLRPPHGARVPPPPQPLQMPIPPYQQNAPMQQMPHGQYSGQYNGGYPQFSSAFPQSIISSSSMSQQLPTKETVHKTENRLVEMREQKLSHARQFHPQRMATNFPQWSDLRFRS